MKMALGFNEQAAEAFLSPKKNGASASQSTVEEEEIYEDVEYLEDVE
jgi:hypothetical protein